MASEVEVGEAGVSPSGGTGPSGERGAQTQPSGRPGDCGVQTLSRARQLLPLAGRAHPLLRALMKTESAVFRLRPAPAPFPPDGHVRGRPFRLEAQPPDRVRCAVNPPGPHAPPPPPPKTRAPPKRVRLASWILQREGNHFDIQTSPHHTLQGLAWDQGEEKCGVELTYQASHVRGTHYSYLILTVGRVGLPHKGVNGSPESG